MKFIFLLLISIFSTCATAEVYKCTDADGKKVYRSHPCESGYNNEEIDLKTGSTTDLDELQKQALLKQQEEQAKLEQQKLAEQLAEQRKQAMLKEAADESQKNQQFIKNNPGKFSAFAIPPYAPDKLTALVKRYETRLPEIERMRRAAAENALATGECTRVEAVELNEKSTPTSLVFLVDCSSAKSFYFNEQELAPQ
ncbi:MAG: DUF4124 domain-containing protein [Methylovulum sp.]|nr:DUF4124 domain-containing protein [Methylovulum sp.]